MLQTDVRTAASARYCAVEGEGQFLPGLSQTTTSLTLNCNYTSGRAQATGAHVLIVTVKDHN